MAETFDIGAFDLGTFVGHIKMVNQDASSQKLAETAAKPEMQKAVSNISFASAAMVGAGVFGAIVAIASASEAITSTFGAVFDLLGAVLNAVVISAMPQILDALRFLADVAKQMISFGRNGGDFGSQAGTALIEEFASGVGRFLQAMAPALSALVGTFVQIFVAVFTNPAVIAAFVLIAGAMALAFVKALGGFLFGGAIGALAGFAIGGPTGAFVGAGLGAGFLGGLSEANYGNSSTGGTPYVGGSM